MATTAFVCFTGGRSRHEVGNKVLPTSAVAILLLYQLHAVCTVCAIATPRSKVKYKYMLMLVCNAAIGYRRPFCPKPTWQNKVERGGGVCMGVSHGHRDIGQAQSGCRELARSS